MGTGKKKANTGRNALSSAMAIVAMEVVITVQSGPAHPHPHNIHTLKYSCKQEFQIAPSPVQMSQSTNSPIHVEHTQNSHFFFLYFLRAFS